MKVLTFLYVVVLRALPVWLLLHLCAKHVLVFYSERYLWLKNWIFSTGLLNLSRSRLDQVSVDALFMILRRGLRLDQGRCAMTLGIDPSTATDTPEQGGHAVVASAPRAHSTAPRCPPPSRAMTLRIDLFTIDRITDIQHTIYLSFCFHLQVAINISNSSIQGVEITGRDNKLTCGIRKQNLDVTTSNFAAGLRKRLMSTAPRCPKSKSDAACKLI